MKVLIVFVVVAVAVVSANLCVHGDPSPCSVTCPSTENKACEHGVCTCSPKCTQASDCATCPTVTDPMGHVHHENAHCIDGACHCMPVDIGQNPDGHPPGPGGR